MLLLPGEGGRSPSQLPSGLLAYGSLALFWFCMIGVTNPVVSFAQANKVQKFASIHCCVVLISSTVPP